jgi:hypothetical protein
VINGTNLLRKDNPRPPNGNATETIAFLRITQPGLTIRRDNSHRVRLSILPRLTHLATLLGVPDRLNGLTHRVGMRLFVKNDTEACWQRWRINELRGGLARRYRDPRFDALRSLHDVAEQMIARIDSPCPTDQDGPLR